MICSYKFAMKFIYIYFKYDIAFFIDILIFFMFKNMFKNKKNILK